MFGLELVLIKVSELVFILFCVNNQIKVISGNYETVSGRPV